MLKKIKLDVMRWVRWRAIDAGYDIRKLESFCWPDQKMLLQDQPTAEIFDVGANSGSVVETYRRLFSQARIHAFEPVESCWNHLDQSAHRAGNTLVNRCALSDHLGEAIFHINSTPDTSSLLAPDKAAIPESYINALNDQAQVSVPVKTIDSYLLEHQIKYLDVLKMDVQGGELKVLHGAKQALTEQRIKLIYTEAFFVPFYKDQPLFGDLAAYLTTLGYSLHSLYNFGFSGFTGRLQWVDAIFVCDELRARSNEMKRTGMRTCSSALMGK